MKRAQLKDMIKPIVEECVRETLLEGGLLSGIISEVAQGLGNQAVIQEINTPQLQETPAPRSNSARVEELKKKKKVLLDAIGKDAYNGINLFEGTNPIRDSGNPSSTSQTSPLATQDPGDPGVDISGILALGGKNWKTLMR